MASIDKINVGGAEYDIKLAPSDTKNDTISYTSNDNSSIFNSGNLGGQSTYAWTAVSKIATGEKHSSLLNKVSTMFKNIRTIAKLIGTTDISSIGNGTLSGGISELNKHLTWKLLNQVTGSTSISLPNGASELYVDVMIAVDSNKYRIYSFHILSRIENVARQYTQGYGASGNNWCVLSVNAASTTLQLSSLVESTVNKTSDALVTVYYK